ncbi:XRE family transcriptional regulator [Pseudoalteromonas sp. J010]|uniref:helix-turn-helix domain-containing protein n=1 Tax=Pseudoalteromonas sp. J010 TaxID=998465 RepID=UPI000F64E443|nr:helix-turn-helix transcriptional regulator [Pseudoalteromonas sp. J010]RRS09334.1 XRE family transcriptional regulator [Pseudoalteromonas sp. J010]
MQTPEEYEVSQRIGRLIAGLKDTRGMTRESICKRLEISTRTLDNYLSGVSSFKLGTLLKLADLCKVKLADILDDTDALSRLYSKNMKDKGGIFTILLGSLAGVMVFESTVFLLLVALFFYAHKDKNSLSIISILLVIYFLTLISGYCLNYIIFPMAESYYMQNTYAFSLHLLLSTMMALSIKHRMLIAAWVTRGKVPSIFERNYVDAPLFSLACCLMFVDFAALIENFIRSSERLGVPLEIAQQFWEVTFFYDYFWYFKAVPSLMILSVLYMGIEIRKRAASSEGVIAS